MLHVRIQKTSQKNGIKLHEHGVASLKIQISIIQQTNKVEINEYVRAAYERYLVPVEGEEREPQAASVAIYSV